MPSVNKQNQFDLIMAANPVPTIVTRIRDGVVKYANASVAELTGLPIDNIANQKIPDFFLYPEEREPIMQELAKKGALKSREIHCKKANGAPFWALVSFTAIDFEGEPSVMTMIFDINERKQAEERARTANTILNQVFERVTDAFVALDKDWRYTYVNARGAELFNRRPADLIGKHIWTEFPEGVGQPFYLAYERAMAEQKPIHFEDYYQPWDRWFENIVYPSPEGLSIYFHDITDRKLAEEQLRRVNRTLRMISDCNQALVRVADEPRLLETICTLIVNEGGYKMAWVGEARHDNEHRVIPLAHAGFEDGYLESAHISWADNKFGRGPIGRAIREGNSVVCHDILHDPAFLPWRGQARRRGYLAMAAFPLTIGEKVINSLNIYASEAEAFYADEIKLLEELAGDLAFGMEVIRQRKDKVVLEHQFRQAQKMEAVGTLAGGIAHDFNNMLAGMLGTTYLVQKKLGDRPDLQQRLKQIEQTGFRAAGMISQLLTFSRKGQIHMQPMSFTLFLKETFKLARSSVPENISFTLNVSETECVLNGDATLLQQVLLNFINNAKHAVSGKSHPEIHISLDVLVADEALWKRQPTLSHKRCAWLTVKDNGYGISTAHLTHLFDPFFTTKEVGEGTGLGLAMAYGAVQSHNGVIEVESEAGKGSSFHVFIPLTEAVHVSPRTDENQVIQGHGETILLADDEELVCEVSRELLESIGYRVLIANNGEEAVSLFEEHRNKICLVVLDVVMPQLGGVDAARRIRASSPCLPVLFQTGYGEEQVREEIANLKDCRVITKPAAISALSHILRELLD